MESEKCRLISYSKENRTVVVVGACSSIGESLVPELLKKYKSIILTENSENYDELLDKYRGKLGIQLCELDVLDKNQIARLKNFLEENNLIIESLIYLSGINILVPALETTEEVWDKIININLKGFFFVAQVMAQNMILHGGGNILGVASQHGVVANINRAAYCASKAGLIHLSKELALEWAKYGIRVNMISPTMILSHKNKEILEGARAKKEYLSKIPLNKYASPQDVASAIMFLNSNKASMITGQNLLIDGGWTIC